MNEISSFRAGSLENVEAEQALLGMILLDNAAYDRVGDVLDVEHFVDPLHQRIYSLCASRITKGHLASPVALAPILAADEGLQQVGGPSYLIRMTSVAPHGKFARDYAKMIVEQATRRALRQSAQEALSALSEGGESQEVKAGLQMALQRLPEVAGEESSVSFVKAMTKAVERAVVSYEGKQQFLRTGVPTLDAILRGLAPGDLMLIGGTTSMGKTSLALEIAGNVAIDQGKRVGFWSLEMEDEQLATRMASARARVPYSDLRDASDMAEDTFRQWVEASEAILSAGIRIVPKHVRDLAAGHAAMRRIKREFEGQLDLVVVDYAQLIRGSGKGRYEQMTEVSVGLKAMAGLLQCPVIALVQLDRKIGERDDKRPQLNDIKETGQFENDADQVVFCHREAYWLERQGPKLNKAGEITDEARADHEADLHALRNVMEIIVRKNRHGRCATARVGFHAPTNRFWQLGQHDDIQGGE